MDRVALVLHVDKCTCTGLSKMIEGEGIIAMTVYKTIFMYSAMFLVRLPPAPKLAMHKGHSVADCL